MIASAASADALRVDVQREADRQTGGNNATGER